MEDDRTRWDNRYATAQPAAPSAPAALVDRPDLREEFPRSGRSLDIAAGTGSTTLWLARRGLHVTALEISSQAIELLEREARAAGVAGRVETRLVDLDDGLPSDLRRLDAVVCQRFRDVRLYPTIIDVLAPGGIGVVTVLSTVGLPGPRGTFHASPGELERAFDRADTELLHHVEREGVASVVFRRTGVHRTGVHRTGA